MAHGGGNRQGRVGPDIRSIVDRFGLAMGEEPVRPGGKGETFPWKCGGGGCGPIRKDGVAVLSGDRRVSFAEGLLIRVRAPRTISVTQSAIRPTESSLP